MIGIGSYDDWSIDEQDLRIFKGLLTDQRLAIDFANNEKSELFIGDAYQVGRAITDYVRRYKALPTHRVLLEQNTTDDKFREKINALYEALPDINFSSSEYSFELERIKQRFVDARIADIRDDFRHKEIEDLGSTLEGLERSIREIKDIRGKQKTYTQKSLKTHLPEFRASYIEQLRNPDLNQGILTGYSYLDYVTNGIREGELLIIAAETSVGKSMMLNNMAIQMWMQKNTLTTEAGAFTKGCNVLYFSLEMPYEACFRRTMARIADVPMYGLRDASLNRTEADAVSLAGKFITRYPYDFDIVDIPRGVSVEMIEERFQEACLMGKRPDVVVVDYLGLMEDPNLEGDDWLKIGQITGKLHEFGRSNNTRVLTAAQLNRLAAGKKEQHEIISMARLGRSGLIGHHCNICIQIESRPDEHLRGDLAYHVIKNRDGEKGSHTVHKKFAHAAIYDVPYIQPDKADFGFLISGQKDNEDLSQILRDLEK